MSIVGDTTLYKTEVTPHIHLKCGIYTVSHNVQPDIYVLRNVIIHVCEILWFITFRFLLKHVSKCRKWCFRVTNSEISSPMNPLDVSNAEGLPHPYIQTVLLPLYKLKFVMLCVSAFWLYNFADKEFFCYCVHVLYIHTFFSMAGFLFLRAVAVEAQHNQSKKNDDRNRMLLKIHIGTPDLWETQWSQWWPRRTTIQDSWRSV